MHEAAIDTSGLDELVSTWRREYELERAFGEPDDLDVGFADDHWVRLAEAEEAAGVSRSALRSWYRTGQIPSRLEPGPHGDERLVPLQAVLERARRAGLRRSRSIRRDPGPAPQEANVQARESSSPEALLRLVDVVTAQAAERERRAEERAERAEMELRSALERAAAEAELRLLRERELQ